jgi:hypothetical protein
MGRIADFWSCFALMSFNLPHGESFYHTARKISRHAGTCSGSGKHYTFQPLNKIKNF